MKRHATYSGVFIQKESEIDTDNVIIKLNEFTHDYILALCVTGMPYCHLLDIFL